MTSACLRSESWKQSVRKIEYTGFTEEVPLRKTSKGGREAGEGKERGQTQMSSLVIHGGLWSIRPIVTHHRLWAASGREMEGVTSQKRWPGQWGQFCREGSSCWGGIQPYSSRGMGMPAWERGSGWGTKKTHYSVLGESHCFQGTERLFMEWRRSPDFLAASSFIHSIIHVSTLKLFIEHLLCSRDVTRLWRKPWRAKGARRDLIVKGKWQMVVK